MTSLPPATNESYEIKRIQMIAAACAAAFMHQLGGRYPPRQKDAWDPERFRLFLQADRWRKDNQIIDFHHDRHDHRKSEYVLFSNPFYGPESDFIEGTPVLLQDVELKVDGLTKVFDNSEGQDPLHIAYTESVDLANAVTEAVAEEFTFDTTTTERDDGRRRVCRRQPGREADGRGPRGIQEGRKPGRGPVQGFQHRSRGRI